MLRHSTEQFKYVLYFTMFIVMDLSVTPYPDFGQRLRYARDTSRTHHRP